MRLITIASSAAVTALITSSVAGVASGAVGSAAAAGRHGGGADRIVQTLGKATRYGTSTPLGVAAKTRRGHAPSGTNVEHLFTHRATAPRSSVLPANLRPPSAAGRRVVTAAAGATGFPGLTNRDQRLAGTGAYAKSQPDLEPPDPGLCAGNGFVVEQVNVAFTVYNDHGKAMTGINLLNQFFRKKPFRNHHTGIMGAVLSDPKCYYDPVGKRFTQTIAEGEGFCTPSLRFHLLIAVSRTSNPTGAWDLYAIDTTDDGTHGTPAHAGCPCIPDQPRLGASKDGVFIQVNEFQLSTGTFNGSQIYALGRAAVEKS